MEHVFTKYGMFCFLTLDLYFHLLLLGLTGANVILHIGSVRRYFINVKLYFMRKCCRVKVLEIGEPQGLMSLLTYNAIFICCILQAIHFHCVCNVRPKLSLEVNPPGVVWYTPGPLE